MTRQEKINLINNHEEQIGELPTGLSFATDTEVEDRDTFNNTVVEVILYEKG